MKVCLIYPTVKGANWGAWPPIGIAGIASYLEEKGHKVSILDMEAIMRRQNMKWEGVEDKAEEFIINFKPDIVGITATTNLIPGAYNAARISKGALHDVPVVIGGPHATVLPEKTLDECKDIDIVVRGEGEITMLELADGLEYEKIAGLTFRDEGRVKTTPDRPLHRELDDFPIPARHLLDMELYTRHSHTVIRGVHMRATSIFTARGCPFRCTFCACPMIFGNRVSFHSPEYVIAEVEHLIDTYKIEGLYFAEDMFLSNKQRAKEICDLMMEHGLPEKIKWAAQLRADFAKPEFLKMLKDAGCIQVEYGYESGSQKMLDIMKKKMDVSKNFESARATKEAGLRLHANFIIGMPHETLKDLEATVDMLRTMAPDSIGYNKLIPLPGTEVYDELMKEGKLSGDWKTHTLDNLTYNYSDIPDAEFEKRYKEIVEGFVSPTLAWAYVKYNYMRDPAGVAGLFGQFGITVLKNPVRAYNLIRGWLRTLNH